MGYILRSSVLIVFFKAMCCLTAESDDALLDEIERAAFQYFWTETNPSTGMIKERIYMIPGVKDSNTLASISATGFGLTGLCIGHKRNYLSPADIESRVLTTINFIRNNLENEHGFFHIFVDMNTGQREESSEVTSIHTALLLAGVLTARQYFSANSEIVRLATEIYERVDYLWMMNGTKYLKMDWSPENGFLSSWDVYSELMILVLQGLGSPTHPIPAAAWYDFARPNITYEGITYITGPTVLFAHQYSHAWIDFRNKQDQYTNYFENSIKATKATMLYCAEVMRKTNRGYNENFCYTWGVHPFEDPVDDTVSPSVAGGSIPFLPDETIAVLTNLRYNYTKQIWGKYGFLDSFNPLLHWTNDEIIGTDIGITMLMAENYRTGFVWEQYMKDPAVNTALCSAGFNINC